MASTSTPKAIPETPAGDCPAPSENRWLLATLKAFTNLPWEDDAWRSDGHRTNPTAAATLLSLLIKIADERMPPPYIIPAWNGGVQAEWHRNGVDLELEVTPEGVAEFFFIDHSGEEHEKDARENIDELRGYIQAII